MPVAAAAADGDAPLSESVVITAPPDPVGNEAFSVVHFDESDLRAEPNLDQALEQVPGLSLFRRNTTDSANPTTQGVSLRSIGPSAAGRALVTLDGVPQNDPFGGWVIWSSLPAEDIASAEIVRGAGAGPYGAGALTGVIALGEEDKTGLAAADASIGDLDTTRLAAAGGAQWGKVGIFASGAIENSGGWYPVAEDQRGAADDKLTLHAKDASLRFTAEPFDGTALSVRLGAYEESRESGLVGSYSNANGYSASATLAHPETPASFGWRFQFWARDSDFSQTSVTVAPGRTFTTPSDLQYATPALGLGVNAAVRGAMDFFDWEIGIDGRTNQGEAREQFSYSTVLQAYTQGRIAGGSNFVAGLYAEGASRFDGWLLTLGARMDEWGNFSGHLQQTTLATGAVTLDQHLANAGGTVPTARAGIRKDLGDGLYLRSAAYIGFRAPSLNELYRPFRLGNNATLANPALRPERLQGAEIGIGGDHGAFSWDGTLYWNQLEDAITNVTIGTGPQTIPGIGAIPAGGSIIQRQNVGDIAALGVEAEAHLRLSDMLSLTAASDLADSHVDGGSQAPQLTGKRPAEAPRWTVTGGFVATPLSAFSFSALVRYESARYVDDLNTMKLGSAFTLDAKAAWTITDNLAAYIAVDNLLNAQIATNEDTTGVFSYDAPRLFRVGLSWVQ